MADRPAVTVHYAQTLDGRIATRTGHSQWIGGEASLRLAHQLRASHQAVMVGVGTVIADNPRLTVRLVPGNSPLRVVVDSTLRLPLDAHLLVDRAAPTLVVTTPRAPEPQLLALRRLGVEVMLVEENAQRQVDLRALLGRLHTLGVGSLLIEGGRGLITAALHHRLVDRLIVCIAPKIVGLGIDAVGDLEVNHLDQAVALRQVSVSRLGEDVIFEGRIAPSPPSPPSLAVWFPGPRRVELRREKLGEVGPRQVRVRALASALSHGTEMLVYRGQVPAGMELDLPTLEGSFGFPIKYGYASVGRVEEMGAEVETPRPGETVFVHHPHQTEYLVPASSAIPLPEGLPPEAGLFVANLETAVNAMLDAGLRLGDRVLILGQGVVGLLLTQLARRAGAGLIVTVDPLAGRRKLSLALGADAALAPGPGLEEEVSCLTDGVGADVAFEASGSGEALAQALPCIAFQGTVLVCSWYGARPVSLPLGDAFHRKRLRLVSTQVSSLDPALQPRWNRARRLALVRELLPSLKLEPLITHRVPFSRAAEAYRLVDQHPEEVVQVILTYGGEDV